jgi:hypothetical protein
MTDLGEMPHGDSHHRVINREITPYQETKSSKLAHLTWATELPCWNYGSPSYVTTKSND